MIPYFSTFVSEAKTHRKITGNLVMKERSLMRKMLRENIVIFKFQKRDGTIRRAVGTLYPDLLPPVKGSGGPKPAYQMVYYDLEKFAWRSFRSFKFIKIIKMTPVDDAMVLEYEKAREKDEARRAAEKRHRKFDEEEYDRREEEKEKEKTRHEEIVHKEKHHEEHEKGDERKKTYKSGEKIPEKELVRRSADFRSGSRKNKNTRKANDSFRNEEEED